MVDATNAATKLQRIVLSWDYWELGRRNHDDGKGPFDTLRTVPSIFKDIQEYKAVFEPLILEECSAQVLRGVEEGEVLKPHACVPSSCDMKEEFAFVRLAMEPEDRDKYSDGDLVMVCDKNPMDYEIWDPAASKHTVHALGMCEGKEGESLLHVKMRLSDESQAHNPAGLARVRAMAAGMSRPAAKWHVLKLASLSTITREWVALQNAHLCPFIDILVSCKPRSASADRHMDIPKGMADTMAAKCNESQMDALRAGLDGSPMVLIQGPPGTGKTRTILNLLSVIMHSASKQALELLSGSRGAVRSGGARAGRTYTIAERLELYHQACPWAVCLPTPYDSVHPWDEVEGNPAQDCYGLTRHAPPLRLGKSQGPKAHVLVCAPSNSALDEIVLRIKGMGLMDKDGHIYAPSVVRVGVNVHHSVRDVSLDAIVEARLGEGDGKKGGIRAGERDRMRATILDEASVVCSTLSFAGSSVFSRLSKRFDVVVIDEAAQAVEPSTLVPLITQGCKQVYLVGDPVQLPATVMSSNAQEHGYDVSLFKRLQDGGYPVKMLNMQYRMHPAISAFPSRQFYAGNLLDGQGVDKETAQPWHVLKCFGPLAFYDVCGKEQTPDNSASIQNHSEANMVLCIFRELTHRYPSLRHKPSVAVISPYKSQVKLIRDSFKHALGEDAARFIDVNTIDGFQGREKDVVIFSCVRSLRKGRRSIGFVADERRINVGLTRARCSLVVVGNARALMVNGNWATLIRHTMDQGCFYRPQAPFIEWMERAAAGNAGPVQPTPAELRALEKAQQALRAAKGEGEVVEVAEELAQELGEEGLGAEDEGDVGAMAAAHAAAKKLAKEQQQAEGGNRGQRKPGLQAPKPQPSQPQTPQARQQEAAPRQEKGEDKGEEKGTATKAGGVRRGRSAAQQADQPASPASKRARK